MTLGASLNLVISTRHEAPATPLDSVQLSPKGRWILVVVIPRRKALRYISSAAHRPGDSCISIYQTQLDKNEKSNFL